jgi:hypothetical protein
LTNFAIYDIINSRGERMDKFKNTLRVSTSRIKGPDALPISEGFNYYDTEKNILYRDINGQRFAIGEFFSIDQFNSLTQESLVELEKEKIHNALVIDKFLEDGTGPEYKLWYVDPDGNPVDLGFGNNSAGIYKQPDIDVDSYPGSQEFTVSACCVNLFATDNHLGPIKRYTLAPKT